ncbi:hypothetical protein J437_LFUL009522 [Ladona fulva]|uniref:Uncharacterized protein n=1 Tax=Ladona fulva TaxID=123851 RepID=A0A8K0NYQ0_LADFU|nr:hypothetical protein J437_LFUL009522 [Ladona fulva]
MTSHVGRSPLQGPAATPQSASGGGGKVGGSGSTPPPTPQSPTVSQPPAPASLMERLLQAKMDTPSMMLRRTDSTDSASSISSITSDLCRCDDCLLGIADLQVADSPVQAASPSTAPALGGRRKVSPSRSTLRSSSLGKEDVALKKPSFFFSFKRVRRLHRRGGKVVCAMRASSRLGKK